MQLPKPDRRGLGSVLISILLFAQLWVGCSYDPTSRQRREVVSDLTDTSPITLAADDSVLPLHFEPGRRSAQGGADFIARGKGYRLALTATEAALALQSAGNNQQVAAATTSPPHHLTTSPPHHLRNPSCGCNSSEPTLMRPLKGSILSAATATT